MHDMQESCRLEASGAFCPVSALGFLFATACCARASASASASRRDVSPCAIVERALRPGPLTRDWHVPAMP